MKNTIWIDLDNSPHVPFFRPIISELENRNYNVIITARDAYQTKELAEYHKIKHKCIGGHAGKNKFLKVIFLILRVIQLSLYMLPLKPIIAVSHGSRSQIISAAILRLKSGIIFDYEYTQTIPLFKPDFIIIPKILKLDDNKYCDTRIFRYDGIKEDVYVPFFKHDKELAQKINLNKNSILITVRPPATEAHYHCTESENLFIKILDHLESTENIKLIILPRSNNQKEFIKQRWSVMIKINKLIIPDFVVDGLNLIWQSDLVISGGGTMNREAAALNVPVYSIFRGKLGAVDKYLNDVGKLQLIQNINDFKKVKLSRRNKNEYIYSQTHNTLNQIVSYILKLYQENSAT